MLRRILLTITALRLVACGSNSSSSDEPSAPSAAAVRFSSAEPGDPDVGAARLRVQVAGKMSIPNGQLALSDAFINDAPLVVKELPRGEYAVELLVAESESDERVAAARLLFSNDSVASWRRAGAIAIDSGTGAFFDPRISTSITPSNIERFNEILLNALETTYRPTYSIAVTTWENMTFVAFSTGFGDGSYPVYLGSSAAGLPVAVLVDCDILPWPQ
jgi:hypothetical protein